MYEFRAGAQEQRDVLSLYIRVAHRFMLPGEQYSEEAGVSVRFKPGIRILWVWQRWNVLKTNWRSCLLD